MGETELLNEVHILFNKQQQKSMDGGKERKPPKTKKKNPGGPKEGEDEGESRSGMRVCVLLLYLLACVRVSAVVP